MFSWINKDMILRKYAIQRLAQHTLIYSYNPNWWNKKDYNKIKEDENNRNNNRL